VALKRTRESTYLASGATAPWSFTYQKIEWTWLGDGGITAQDDWEVPTSS